MFFTTYVADVTARWTIFYCRSMAIRFIHRAIFIVIEQTVRWYNAQYKTAGWHKSPNNRLCIYSFQIFWVTVKSRVISTIPRNLCFASWCQCNQQISCLLPVTSYESYDAMKIYDTWLGDESGYISVLRLLSVSDSRKIFNLFKISSNKFPLFSILPIILCNVFTRKDHNFSRIFWKFTLVVYFYG